jgi:hypothetical protein
MRTVLFTVVTVMALSFGAGVTTAATPAATTAVAQREAAPAAVMHPTWVRTCGFANCSVYFNKAETRIAAYGGALLSSLICTMLRSTPAALVCTAISWAVGKAGDNAVSGGRCVKISFSRWTGVVYSIGTYSGSQCK